MFDDLVLVLDLDLAGFHVKMSGRLRSSAQLSMVSRKKMTNPLSTAERDRAGAVFFLGSETVKLETSGEKKKTAPKIYGSFSQKGITFPIRTVLWFSSPFQLPGSRSSRTQLGRHASGQSLPLAPSPGASAWSFLLKKGQRSRLFSLFWIILDPPMPIITIGPAPNSCLVSEGNADLSRRSAGVEWIVNRV